MKRLLYLVVAAIAAFQIWAAPNKDFPKVEDTSDAEANGNRVIRLAVDVRASTNEVWQTLSAAEGWKSFAVAFASMEMQVGGILETSYKADAPLGDPDNIKNQIVAYVPGRMLAIRCLQTPRDFAHKEEFFATATVIEIAPNAGGGSRVSLTAVGYRPGEAYDLLFKHFRWADAYTLDKLRSRFETGNSVAPVGLSEAKSFNQEKK
jgi:uncharacterized protein YndB with AHSA1/START domain